MHVYLEMYAVTKLPLFSTFFSIQDEVAAGFISLTKTLYDLHKAHEPAEYKGSPLDQLVVENFDEEQIWQELELQNDPVLKHLKNVVNDVVSDETLTVLEEGEDEEEEDAEDEGETDENCEEEEKELPRQSEKMADEENFTDEDSDLDFDVDALEKREKMKMIGKKDSKIKNQPSEVDDKFFKLSEMESFLDDMDKQEGKGKDNEDDLDYFQDVPSDDDDELDLDQILSNKKEKNTVCNLLHILFPAFYCDIDDTIQNIFQWCSQVKSSRNLKYKDYFDAVDHESAKADDQSDGEDDSMDESHKESEEEIDDDDDDDYASGEGDDE